MNTRRRLTLLVALSLVLTASVSASAQAPAAAATPRDTNAWRVDQTHSELTFSIRHLISRVRGQFNK